MKELYCNFAIHLSIRDRSEIDFVEWGETANWACRELISFISSLSIEVELVENNMIGVFQLLTYVYFNYIFHFANNKIVFYWKN